MNILDYLEDRERLMIANRSGEIRKLREQRKPPVVDAEVVDAEYVEIRDDNSPAFHAIAAIATLAAALLFALA